MAYAISSVVPIGEDVFMPIIGLGTFLSEPGEKTRNAVRWALEAGYRHVDTARIYGNEKDVGEGIKESGIPRQEVFITTKVWNDDQGYDSTLKACEESLKRLGVDYIDLYLIHWPVPEKRLETWKALIRLREEGLVRAIGVSNFMVRHLEELMARSDVPPAVNQVEISPFIQRKALVEYCRKQGIVVEAYSTLSRGQRLGDPRLLAMAGKYGKTPAQIALRWAIQEGIVVIPKSVHRERILENAAIFDFELTEEDRKEISRWDEHFSTLPPSWEPETSTQWD
ncbi:MAG TPA: aldo/keto reductase [Syntrophales bacterium]|nr:aldo/keto reductase [Syntrophales bacterium]HOL59276.1 aldo/keto reductase [Syntrophales bacterium]HPO35326.1 aldo/keto reductase [Syntrophales bacterium]